MAFSGGFGIDGYTMTVPRAAEIDRDDVILFSESNSRFLCEVAPENVDSFEKCLKGIACAPFGRVIEEKRLRLCGLKGEAIINEDLSELKAAWQAPLAQ